MDKREAVLDNIILKGIVGSQAFGTRVDGAGDTDMMGVFIEPPEFVCGLYPLDHHIERDKPEGVRSEPGDTDLSLYSLRKFCRLALSGNPSVLCLLFLSEYEVNDYYGQHLVGIRDAFYSRRAGNAFLQYLVNQRRSFMGERTIKVQRPDLVEKYGYDTKFAMHALRLGLQGIEYLQTRAMTFPIREPDRQVLIDVRTGKLGYYQAADLILMTEAKLQQAYEDTKAIADEPRVEKFLVSMHRSQWKW